MMKKTICLLVLLATCYCPMVKAQQGASFRSTDTAMQKAYEWALQMCLHYRGNPNDPVGPWYEAALPSRFAFCMRDVSHQTIGASIAGLDKENKNMLRAFAENIAESRDGCSFWEINREGKPAPEDYRNDREFWYNLNANFDLMFACWKLYVWTGDKFYIEHPVFTRFFSESANGYISKWILQPDSLLTRPRYPNAPSPFNNRDNFHLCRGLPSYVEDVPELTMGVDLIAAIYGGLLSYASVLTLKGDTTQARKYREAAEQYRQKIDNDWWNGQAYNTYFAGDGKFGRGGGEMFLLWFDALGDTSRRRKTLDNIIAEKSNVETTSYLPMILFREGYWKKASGYILQLTDTAEPRRTYPEVAYAVVESVVHGLMGVVPDATKNCITTLYRGNTGSSAELEHLRVLNTEVNVKHTGTQTVFSNKGKKRLLWRAEFSGDHDMITVDGKPQRASHWTDNSGNRISYVDVSINGNTQVKAGLR